MNSSSSSDINLLLDDALAHKAVHDFVVRMQLIPSILRRQQEEKLIPLAHIEPEFLQKQLELYLGDRSLENVLIENRLTLEDLHLQIARTEALLRFAEQRFGPGLEESFLSSGGGHDQVIYSLLRVKNRFLAQELWIRLEEGEATFSDLATSHGEGPEASRKGLIGPVPIGNIAPPELSSLIRTLQIGQISPPTQLGDWFVLIRLEQLTPSRFDSKMRKFLLNQQLEQFFDQRVQSILRGDHVEDLETIYHS